MILDYGVLRRNPRLVVKEAIDLVIDNAKRHKYRTAEFRFLGGGEPTLEWDLIVWDTHYIRYRALVTGSA